jgi:hypothetical protein
MCNVCDGENYVNVSAYRILTTFYEKLQFCIQLQESPQYCYCNVLYAGIYWFLDALQMAEFCRNM